MAPDVVAPPREGLPPCLRMARFDERAATFHDKSCGAIRFPEERFTVSWGTPTKWGEDLLGIHTGIPPVPIGGQVTKVNTDDPTEAEVAWEKAERWVRTGELDA